MPAPSADAEQEGAGGARWEQPPESRLAPAPSLLLSRGLPLAKPNENPECTGAQ